jgi:hypothetical protein
VEVEDKRYSHTGAVVVLPVHRNSFYNTLDLRFPRNVLGSCGTDYPVWPQILHVVSSSGIDSKTFMVEDRASSALEGFLYGSRVSHLSRP